MNAPTTVTPPERLTYVCLAVFVAALWLATLGIRPLFNPDEGRYAEIPREMLADGDWVIPHLNGLAYIEKPPLQYWATAASLAVFGPTAFAARLYTALCAIATLGVVWLLAGRLCGEAAAWRAAAVLGGMLLFLVLGQLLTLDMSLTGHMTVALAAFLMAQPVPRVTGMQGLRTPRVGPRGWMMLAWTATALGVLTKGFVAAVIPLVVLLVYSAVARDLKVWRRLQIGWGLPLFLVLTLPWHWLAARRLNDFLQFYVVHEHFARYLTPSAERLEPWWFFGVVLLAGSLPWTVSAVRAIGFGWQRRAPRGEFDPMVFLWCWTVSVIGFFSVSDSKLIPYILPALPALAVLIGASTAKALRREVLITGIVTAAAAVALAFTSWYAPQVLPASARNTHFLDLAKPLAEIAGLLAVVAAFVLSQRRRGITHGTVFLGAGWCVAGMLLMRAAFWVAPIYSGAGLAPALAGVAQDVPVYSVATYDWTLPFYSQRPLILVHYRGEFSFGQSLSLTASLASVDEFLDRWQGSSAAYAFMEDDMFEQLTERRIPMREVSRNSHSVLVSRR